MIYTVIPNEAGRMPSMNLQIVGAATAADARWAITKAHTSGVRINLRAWSLGNCPITWVVSHVDMSFHSGNYLYCMDGGSGYWCFQIIYTLLE